VTGIAEVVLRPAAVWDPNDGPVPIKKWFLMSDVLGQFRVSIGGGGFRRLRFRATLNCGGVPLFSDVSSTRRVEPNGSQTITLTFDFDRCIECPIDEDITLSFDADYIASGSTGSIISVNYEYDVKGVCF